MKTLKLRVTGLYEVDSPVTVEFPHKGPVTRKKFPFHEVNIFDSPNDPTSLVYIFIFVRIISFLPVVSKNTVFRS